jgi:hypothetical protein
MASRTLSSQITTDTALVTTAETVVATLDSVTTPRAVNVTLRAWAQLTTGTATTAVTPRIRRGTTAAGTLINEGNPVTLGAAAGGTEDFEIDAVDLNADISGASYVLTLQQTAATGNGSCLQAQISASIPE